MPAKCLSRRLFSEGRFWRNKHFYDERWRQPQLFILIAYQSPLLFPIVFSLPSENWLRALFMLRLKASCSVPTGMRPAPILWRNNLLGAYELMSSLLLWLPGLSGLDSWLCSLLVQVLCALPILLLYLIFCLIPGKRTESSHYPARTTLFIFLSVSPT